MLNFNRGDGLGSWKVPAKFGFNTYMDFQVIVFTSKYMQVQTKNRKFKMAATKMGLFLKLLLMLKNVD